MIKNIAGIDYSMTCPCVCVANTDNPFTFENCQFFYMTNLKYLTGQVMDNIHGTFMDSKDFTDDITRFDHISNWAIKHMLTAFMSPVTQVAIEGYSMGSKGKVFNIAENTALLKYKMLKSGMPYEIYAPKQIKMFAINNSPLDFSDINKNKIQKEELHEIFVEETGVNLREVLTPKKKKVDSPVSDIIDSYYIAKYLSQELQNDETESPQCKSP